MRRLILAALFAPLLLPFAAAAQDATSPSIVISEVAWAGSSVSLADEWLELTNVTNVAVDVSGWSIDSAAASGGTLVLPADSIIEPHSAYLIANYANGNEKSTLAIEPDYVTTTLSLSNSAILLSLRDDSGLVVDRAGDGGGPFAGSVETFLPMTRASLEDGGLASSWVTPEAATPGVPESFTAIETTEAIEVVEDVDATDPVSNEPFIIPNDSEASPSGEATETIVEPAAEADTAFESIETTVTEFAEEEAPVVSLMESEAIPAEESVIPITEEPPPQNDTMTNFPIGTLIINELVSDPVEGQSEWIEIFNPYNNVIPLAGWAVRDASGKTTALPDQLLGWEQFVVVENPIGKLNNDGDVVELLDATGQVIDAVSYGTEVVPAIKDPHALARDENGAWVGTSIPTPKTQNQFPEPMAELGPPSGHVTEEEQVILSDSEGSRDSSPASPDQNDTIAVISPTTLRLSEIYPNTSGNDLAEEFIELGNTGTKPVDLIGWTLEDASGKRFIAKSSLVIAPGALLTLPRSQTHIALNNNGDSIRLLASDGSLVDEQSYETSTRGYAYARISDVWTWTATPTPDEPNQLSVADDPDSINAEPAPADRTVSTTVRRSSARRTSDAVRDVTVLQALSLEDGVRVRVTGTVTALPGQIGRQVFYLSDDQAGIQIYQFDASFPAMAEGDVAVLTGTLSSNRGERRIKIGANDSVAVMGHAETATLDVAIASVDASMTGRLIRIQAMVAKRSGSRIVLEQDGATLLVSIPSASEVAPSQFPPGAIVSVHGILVAGTDGLRLLPRTPEDVALVEAAPVNDTAAIAASSAKTASDRNAGLLLTSVTLAAIAALAIRHAIPRLRSIYADSSLRVQTQKAD